MWAEISLMLGHKKHTFSAGHYELRGLKLGSNHLSIAWFCSIWDVKAIKKGDQCPYSVDFPAPLAPTIAILESRPMSKLTPLRRILSGVYPNVTSFICNSGGDIFSVSGKLLQSQWHWITTMKSTHVNCSVSSASGGWRSGNYAGVNILPMLRMDSLPSPESWSSFALEQLC